jgi:hypothetical protein
VLVFVHFILLLSAAHPHPWLNIDIIVYTIYIGKGVMNHIMLHVPHKAVSTQDIQRECRDNIHPFVLAETAMAPHHASR